MDERTHRILTSLELGLTYDEPSDSVPSASGTTLKYMGKQIALIHKQMIR